GGAGGRHHQPAGPGGPGARQVAPQATGIAGGAGGRFRKHHALLVSQLLAHLDYLDEALEILTAQIEEALSPFATEAARLDAIPGVGPRTAEILIAELGVDMRQFPTARHVASWAGL